MSVVSNGFWIAGLALILAGLSYYYWLAGQMGRPLSQELTSPPFQRVALAGLVLVGAGLALTAAELWQILPAAALALVSVAGLFQLLRGRAR